MEVDGGLIEAAQAMGDSPSQIIFRVYLKESIPAIAGQRRSRLSLADRPDGDGRRGRCWRLGRLPAIRYGHQRKGTGRHLDYDFDYFDSRNDRAGDRRRDHQSHTLRGTKHEKLLA